MEANESKPKRKRRRRRRRAAKRITPLDPLDTSMMVKVTAGRHVLVIGEIVQVSLSKTNGQDARLLVQAPPNITVQRKEIE